LPALVLALLFVFWYAKDGTSRMRLAASGTVLFRFELDDGRVLHRHVWSSPKISTRSRTILLRLLGRAGK
jgi:hypothetical protein